MKLLAVYLVLASMLLCISFDVFAQKEYRIKKVNAVEYLLPPGARIGREGIFGNRRELFYHKKFCYQRIIITGLGKRYDVNKTRIDRAVYEYDRKPIDQRLFYNYRILRRTLVTTIPYCRVYFSADSSALMLEFDMGSLLGKHRQMDIDAYLRTKLFPGVLQIFGQIEEVIRLPEKSRTMWAPGTTEAILEKVLDALPWPQALAPARFGSFPETECSAILITPRLVLRDNIARRDTNDIINYPYHWQYRRTSDVFSQIFRDTAGRIQQIPYAEFSKNIQPSNLLRDSTVLLASSGDIQFSESTKFRDYLLFWQARMKRNTNQNLGSSEFDRDSTRGISLLLHFDALSELHSAWNACDEARDHKPRSSAGNRSLTTLGFFVFVDDVPCFMPMRSMYFQLREAYNLPSNIVWLRNSGNEYHRMTLFEPNTFLLPGDRFKTQKK